MANTVQHIHKMHCYAHPKIFVDVYKKGHGFRCPLHQHSEKKVQESNEIIHFKVKGLRRRLSK